MKKIDYIIKSFINAGGVFAYISLIAWFFFNGEKFFGNQPSFLIPILMLLLFIISALVTGVLVLGKPILMYFNNMRKEGLILLSCTVLWLIIFLATILFSLVL